MEVEVGNVGKSPAYDVEIAFYPALPEPDLEKLNANNLDRNITYRIAPLEILRESFAEKSTWAPGVKFPFPYWVPHRNQSLKESAEGIAGRVSWEFTYFDSDKHCRPRLWLGLATKYREVYEINTNQLRGITFESRAENGARDVDRKADNRLIPRRVEVNDSL